MYDDPILIRRKKGGGIAAKRIKTQAFGAFLIWIEPDLQVVLLVFGIVDDLFYSDILQWRNESILEFFKNRLRLLSAIRGRN